MSNANAKAVMAIAGTMLSDDVLDTLYSLFVSRGRSALEEIKQRADVDLPNLVPMSVPLEIAGNASYAKLCDMALGMKTVMQAHFAIGHNALYYEDAAQFGAMLLEDDAEKVGDLAASPDAQAAGPAARQVISESARAANDPYATLAQKFQLATYAENVLEQAATDLATTKLPQTMLSTILLGRGIRDLRESQQLQVFTGLLDLHGEDDTLAGDGKITQLAGVGDPISGLDGMAPLDEIFNHAFGLTEQGDPLDPADDPDATASPPTAEAQAEARAKLEEALTALDRAVARINNRSLVASANGQPADAETGSFLAAIAGIGAGIAGAIKRRRARRAKAKAKAMKRVKALMAQAVEAKQAADAQRREQSQAHAGRPGTTVPNGHS